jgi:hypothetical protein
MSHGSLDVFIYLLLPGARGSSRWCREESTKPYGMAKIRTQPCNPAGQGMVRLQQGQ